jgi:hypothetical protein
MENNNNQKYEIQTMTHIPGENEGRKRKIGGGVKGIPIIYNDMETYIEGLITSKGNHIKFKIDKDDLERVQARQWYNASNGYYIACQTIINGETKMIYLHNFIMNNIVFPGRGTKMSIDHINRDGLDNRKENLRLVTQTQQNINKKPKARTATLPEGITEIPTHIWYIKANGAHGDRFGIDLKSEKFKWKTTSSKSVSITDKLKQAIEKLQELYIQYPHLKKDLTKFI